MKPVSTPVYRAWAEKHGTPWEVTFPRRGAVLLKRRYFPTEQLALDAIKAWNDEKPETGLGKRLLDEVLYVRSLLPSGVSFTDLWRFYSQHHAGLVDVTLETVCSDYITELKKQKKSPDYIEEQENNVKNAKEDLGATTVFSALSKGRLLKFIKAPDSYWSRYARKRLVSVLISKARELEAIKVNPLDGWKFEDAPKKTPHTLKLWEIEAILEFTLKERPELVASFALKLFAGIRTEELCRTPSGTKRPLSWDDIVFGEKIDLPVAVSKTNDRRVITFWPAALTHWVAAGVGLDKLKGTICPVNELDDAQCAVIRRLNKARGDAGLPLVDFQQNDFRRTYASNCYAIHGAATADWTGHSLKVLKKSYRDFIEKPAAEAYFASKPINQPLALSA